MTDTANRPVVGAEMLPKLYHVGEQSLLINRLQEAAWCFEQAALLDPGTVRPLKNLAKVRQLQGRPQEARALMQQALALGADGVDRADSYTVLGQICQAEGDFPAAAAAFGQAIGADPHCAAAHLRLALLPGAGDAGARVGDLERLQTLPSLSVDQRAMAAFALGREYETRGDYDRSFERYKAGNDIRRAQYPGYADTFSSAEPMQAVFTPALFAERRGGGDPSPSPVFIVGMMRSGTTLVEQILASHPQVHGHGELSDIRQIAAGLGNEVPGGPAYPDCIAGLDAAVLTKAAAAYLARREAEGPGAARHIDKLPHNFEHVGLIALLFPNARFIHCARDPLDVCISNYFQDFGYLNPFTYDLGTLGRYCRAYEQLMAHWHAVLPGRILRIAYEDLVADQEGWSRRAVEFLGLPWDAACLDFHRNTRAVFTKSLWQVRQPIFQTSIGRWRPYERYLGALIEGLKARPGALPLDPAKGEPLEPHTLG